MPDPSKIYTVEIDGTKYDLEGTRPPTEAEAREAVAAHKGGNTGPSANDQAGLLALHGMAPGEHGWKDDLASALEPMAHPQTAGDFASLLIPSEGAAAVGRALRPIGEAAVKYGGAAADVAASFVPPKAKAALGVLRSLSPTEWNSPLTVAGREGRAAAASRAFNELPLAEQMKSLPTSGGASGVRMGDAPFQPQTPFAQKPLYQQMQDLTEVPTAQGSTRAPAPPIQNLGHEVPAQPAPVVAAEQPASSLSDIDLVRQEVAAGRTPQSVLDRLEKTAAGPQKPPSGMTRIDPDRPPITVTPDSAMRPDLQGPRATVGAEQVGRQTGQTIQQVRDTTGPIRGEGQGQAAGMPTKPMDRIVQKLIDMGPKGQGLPETEREAYAAKGTSDKTRLQVQAYLDALRKVGFAVPAAMGARDLMVNGIERQQ